MYKLGRMAGAGFELSFGQHRLGAVDTGNRVSSMAQRNGMAACAASEIEHAGKGPVSVSADDLLDQVALGLVVLLRIERIVEGGVLSAE